MKHFNADRMQPSTICYDLRSKNNSPRNKSTMENDNEHIANITQQYHGQDSMSCMDSSRLKFHYSLAAPTSVATKLNEDTMTYLNQGQAYEVKLENTTDVAEVKKGFMCSIINIGFQERHMQQAENELWQQWSQQHPNEKILTVDMKLSYNVFGVESDGLNKYEFLWDSSKGAGVFIRINSISTEFTPKKHGGEKGVPFKLSIETFSYNSKTHDSFFISAASCQIKVFKPKGAERKIRSDRDKVSKRSLSEQEKYNRSWDHTTFKECSLESLHPTADGSLCYYGHSHGHFASKQVISATNVGGTQPVQANPNTHQSDEENEQVNNSSLNRSPAKNQQAIEPNRAQESSPSSDEPDAAQGDSHQREIHPPSSRSLPRASNKNSSSDCPTSRQMHQNQYSRVNIEHDSDNAEDNYSPQQSTNSQHLNSDLLQLQQPSAFNQMYHGNQVRSVASLALNNPQHFSMGYYGHALPTSMQPHIPQAGGFGVTSGNAFTTAATHANLAGHFPLPSQQHLGMKGASSIYRQLSHDKQFGVGCAASVAHATPFKASNLALSNHHDNIQTYLGNHSDQCADAPAQEHKDGSSNQGIFAQDNFDSIQSIHSIPSLHSSQQLFRQRSASTSLTAPSGNYPGYTNSQVRHTENSNSSFLEDILNTNHWFHSHQSNNSQMTSPNSSCTQRSGSNMNVNQNQDQAYNQGQNYDISDNEQYNSAQNSPNKNNPHNTNNSSPSCYPREKTDSTLNCGMQQEQLDSLKSGSNITVNSSCAEVLSWFTANRFGIFAKTFTNFCGADLLRLSRTELIEICGLIDGIRLFNSLHNQPIKPRRVLYVCYQNNEIFHPIYLYDVTLRELLRELAIVFRSQLPSCENHLNIEKHQKSLSEKSTINSNSSTDSRSSMGTLSIETANDVYNQNDNYFSEGGIQRHVKGRPLGHRSSSDSGDSQQNTSIDRLLIEGATVKVLATEQVVQMLADESVWTLSLPINNSGSLEACISSCRPRRSPK